MDEIRPLSASVDILPRTHGSALFTRGADPKFICDDTWCIKRTSSSRWSWSRRSKRFMLHYNFPAFAVGETGRYGAPGRREIGHGALGEKALLQVIPMKKNSHIRFVS